MSLIVLLDTDVVRRGDLADLARPAANNVRAFGSAADTLDWLASHEACLAIVAIDRTGIDAVDFVRRLHALPGRERTPVLLVAAPDERTVVAEALDAGATEMLHTPVDALEFATRCRTLLQLAEQQRRLRDDDVRPVRDRADVLAQLIDAVPVFISAADPQGRVVFANAMRTNTQMPAIGPPVPDPMPDFDEFYHKRSAALDALVFRSGRALPAFEQEVSARGGGGRRVLLTTKSPLRDERGDLQGVLTSALDITARKELEQHLQHAASHDGLTDLPNRSMLQARLNALLERGLPAGRIVALHLLDLDRFRRVNDRLGQRAGDAVLLATAGRLRDCVGPAALIARIGADEFAVLQSAVARVEDVALLAQRMLDAVAQPLSLGEQDISITASIGISLSPVDTGRAAEMLRRADLAMFQSKTEGGNRLRFFVPDMERRIAHSSELQRDLRRALGADEFELFYQPQMNLRSSRVCGVEALLRWNHPGRGLMLPGEFLPTAEEGGLMGEIDEWVLRRACREAAGWNRSGFGDIRVGVNISPIRISADRTRSAIAASLDESGLPPSLLEIELTERDLVQDLDGAARALGELRSKGVQVAIDDFGVGYSFLGHVKALPADRIKIDQSFIRDLMTDEGDATIVRAVVAMAHGLRLGVVAEGVETVEQFTQLAVDGCDDIQGYYVSRPLPLPALMNHLRANRTALT